MNKNNLIERLKQYRQQKGLSQEGLARLIGVSWGTINRWERGKSQMSHLAKVRIAEVIAGGEK